MKVEARIIIPKVILLTFEKQFDITSTLLRFQEHYESPKYRRKIFTLDEYKKWYTKTYSKKGKFTYYTDWNGFNIPSHIFKPFKQGKFNPLSEKEKIILNILEGIRDPFYVIGVHRESKDKGLLDHELKHALFYTNEEYRKEALEILSKYDWINLKTKLGQMGYTKEVFLDEIHAYVSDKESRVKKYVQKEIKIKLIELFNRYKKVLGTKNYL